MPDRPRRARRRAAGRPRHRDRQPRNGGIPRSPSSRPSSRSSPPARARSSPRPRAGWPAPRPPCATPVGGWTRDLAAPAAGTVADVFRRTGEIAGPRRPRPLPPPRRRLEARRLGVRRDPRDRRHRPRRPLSPSAATAASPDLTATVSYVSDKPEFTPPGHLLRREPPEARLPRRGENPPPDSRPPPPWTDRRCLPRPALTPETVIDVRHLTKRFGGRTVVDDVLAPRSAGARSSASSAPTAPARPRRSA